MSSPKSSSQSIKARLRFARGLLIAAALVQIVPLLANPGHMSQRTFNVVFLSTALFSIVGFLIVYLQLNLADDALANSPVRRLLGPNMKFSLVLFFVLALFVPLLNLPIIVWAYLKARSATSALDKHEVEVAALSSRKARL